jgi:hypothetical protein
MVDGVDLSGPEWTKWNQADTVWMIVPDTS